MGQIGGEHPEIVEALLKALSDSDEDARQAAATGLGQIGGKDSEVVEALLPILSDSDKDVGQAAVTALEQISSKYPEIVEHLSNFLEKLAANLLRLQNRNRSQEITYTILARMITLSGQTGGRHPQTVEVLLKAFSERDEQVRRAAITGLGQIEDKHPEVVEALLKALSDPDWHVRQAAITGLRTARE